MSDIAVERPIVPRPKRADARRNYDKLLAAAKDAFAADGTTTSLEDVARRAEVGIGTLYRHFPTRQDLLEAVYIDEMEAMCASTADFADLEPWDALAAWLRRFVGYAATKRVLAEELLAFIDADNAVFQGCGQALRAAGGPLLERAQAAGVARPDASFPDVTRMVAGIAGIRNAEPGQIERIFELALDGLRYSPPS